MSKPKRLKVKHGTKVSAKSARSAGQSRDSRLPQSAGIPAIDKELAKAEVCDALDPHEGVVYFKKQRTKRTKSGEAGSWYTGRAAKGEKCGALAIMTVYRNGKRCHRCARHIGNIE